MFMWVCAVRFSLCQTYRASCSCEKISTSRLPLSMSSSSPTPHDSLINTYESNRSTQRVLLSEESGKVQYCGKRCSLLLTEDCLTIFAAEKENERTVLSATLTEDLIGLKYTEKKQKDSAEAREGEREYLVDIFAYPVTLSRCCCLSLSPSASSPSSSSSALRERRRTRVVLSLVFRCERTLCEQWWQAVQHVVCNSERVRDRERQNVEDLSVSLSTDAGLASDENEVHTQLQAHAATPVIPTYKPRKMLIFVNPASGAGTALRIYERDVAPMLSEASVQCECITTTHAGHARDILMHYDPEALAALYCVAVVGGDGLLFEIVQGIGARHDAMQVFHSLALVAIPGGTGNGLAKSILSQSREAFSPRNAVFVALRGRPAAMDLSRVETKKTGEVFYSFLSLTWGLIADIDLLSEGMRFLGESRVFLAASYFIAAKRSYPGRIRMQLVEQPQLDEQALSSVSSSSGSNYAQRMQINRLIDTDDREPNHWVTITSEFVLVWVNQTSHVSASVFSSPGKRMDDGFFTIYVVQSGISRAELLMLMLDVDSGKHVFHEKLRVFQCTQYSLTPLSRRGLFSLDGEKIDYTPLSVTMLPSAAKTIVL